MLVGNESFVIYFRSCEHHKWRCIHFLKLRIIKQNKNYCNLLTLCDKGVALIFRPVSSRKGVLNGVAVILLLENLLIDVRASSLS